MIAINKIRENYGNEIAVVILCCRVYMGTAPMSELEPFIAHYQINWETFICLAKGHRIRPVVYKIIIEANIPSDIKTHIRAEYTEIIMRNWKCALETERIILLLKESNIDAVPYKGVAYSMQFYGDLISRESTDIDLVINSDCLDQVIPVLKKDGYRPELEDIYQYLGKRYFSFYKDFNLNKFNGRIREFHLELHWGIADNNTGVNPKANDLIFNTGRSLPGVKATLNGLDPISHFSAILIHHAVKDNFKFLKNIVDISQAIRQPHVQANGDRLKKDFEEIDLKKALVISDELSGQIMGVSLSQIHGSQNTEKIINHFITRFCSRKFNSSGGKVNVIASIKDTALLKDSLGQRFRFYLLCLEHRFIPTHADFRTVRLPGPFFFVYYILKPLRSFLKPYDPLAEKKKLVPGKSD